MNCQAGLGSPEQYKDGRKSRLQLLFTEETDAPQLLSTASDMPQVGEGQKTCTCGQLRGIPMRGK